MKCPYCSLENYEVQDTIRNTTAGRLKEVCICFNCDKVFEIGYQCVCIIKTDGK